eukprot:SAG22_NODE_1618_length_3971_cov_2.707645_7_plen_42_part_01
MFSITPVSSMQSVSTASSTLQIAAAISVHGCGVPAGTTNDFF